MRRITVEQETSAHEFLTAAGVQHGDTAEVDIAVGVISGKEDGVSPHVAFCSSWIERTSTIKRGGYFERRKPIVGEIEFVNAGEVHDRLKGKTGIAFMKAQVHSNGHVTLNVDPNSIDVRTVQTCELPSLNRRSMKPAARRFIRAKKKETQVV